MPLSPLMLRQRLRCHAYVDTLYVVSLRHAACAFAPVCQRYARFFDADDATLDIMLLIMLICHAADTPPSATLLLMSCCCY